MKGRDILIAFIIIVALVVAVLLIKNKKTTTVLAPSASPSIQQQIESKFQGITIPVDEEHIELIDVSGGVGMGIATKTEILADLPTPPKGQFYKAFLLSQSGKSVSLGNLDFAKGGWMLSYDLDKYPDYKKVVVSLNSTNILEGSF